MRTSTGPPAPCSLHTCAQLRMSKHICSLPFHFHSTIGLLRSLSEARTMVQNVHNYILHMRHRAGISLLVLSIYVGRNWEVYNERLCSLTFYEAPNCQGYFYSQHLTVWCWIQSSSRLHISPCAYNPILPLCLSDCSVSDYCQLKHRRRRGPWRRVHCTEVGHILFYLKLL